MSSLDKQYLGIMKDILENGNEKGDRTGTGTKSIFGREIRHKMSDGFPLLTTKKLYIKGIIHELLWFLKGDTNVKYLQDNNVKIWDAWADKNGDLGPVYGKQWVDLGGTEDIQLSKEKNKTGHYGYVKTQKKGINQIQNIIDRLQTNPDCRRLMVSAWNVSELDKMALMPCHYGFQVWTRVLTMKEKSNYAWEKLGWTVSEDMFEVTFGKDSGFPQREISLMWNQRSCDYLLGIPYNIASYGFLLEMFAQQSNMVAGDLIGRFGDTHLYNNHMKYAEEQIARNPSKYTLPKLVLNRVGDIFSYHIDDFQITNYQAYPNWTGGNKPPIST